MLSVANLTRTYGSLTALDDVSFEVRPGRITGFVGANGAGKTTTMRIMLGVLAPSAGTVLWNSEPLTDHLRRSFGYMPEERGLYPKMRVLDQLVFFARLHGATKDAAASRATYLLDRLGLEDRSGDVLETLSLGNQQRVQIAAALMHEPIALVLDEPFSGLDPMAVDAMMQLLRDEVGDDVPVLFSSHQLDLVEQLCDDLVILSAGRLVAAGPVDGLREGDRPRYRFRLADPSDAAQLPSIDGCQDAKVDGAYAWLDLVDEAAAVAVMRRVIQQLPVLEFGPERRSLTDIFKEAVR